MITELEQLHFIRPLWLLAIPALLLVWILMRHSLKSAEWDRYISKELLSALQLSQVQSSSAWRYWLMSCWLILCLAMAGPSWVKTPLPTIVNQQALVLVLDLSPSMLAEDVSPNRLTRAKFKMIDIIRKRADGQIALIAYAGDAHTVSPLSDDPATIEALLNALSPGMMPIQGSNTEAAISHAIELLKDARATSSEILLLTDGVTPQAQQTIRQQLSGLHTLSILSVGGKEAAPIPNPGGGFLRTPDGEIIMAAVNSAELGALARALGGRHSRLRADDQDINYLLDNSFQPAADNTESENIVYDSWQDMGHWLVLLVLPFALYSFRKGLVYLLPLAFILPIDSQAAEWPTKAWQNLWKTADQQAAELMRQEQYKAAANKFSNEDWAAIANYRNGDYQKATEQFGAGSSITDLYNSANALALSGELEKAKLAYKQVLEQQPQHEDAAHNLDILEQMQDQQSESSEQDSEQPESSGQQKEQSKDQQSEEESKSDSENQQQQESDQQQSEQQNPEQDPQSDPQDSDQSPAEENEEQSAEQMQEQQEQAQQEQMEQLAEDSSSPVRDTPSQLKDASEQWLRTIDDDPSGLLKRKFEYQAWKRAQDKTSDSDRPAPTEPRY